MKIVAVSLLSAGGLAVLVSMLKTQHFVKSLFLSVLQGIAAFFAVNATGLLTGVTLTVNWYTLGFSALFGTPGVISILLLDTIFSV